MEHRHGQNQGNQLKSCSIVNILYVFHGFVDRCVRCSYDRCHTTGFSSKLSDRCGRVWNRLRFSTTAKFSLFSLSWLAHWIIVSQVRFLSLPPPDIFTAD